MVKKTATAVCAAALLLAHTAYAEDSGGEAGRGAALQSPWEQTQQAPEERQLHVLLGGPRSVLAFAEAPVIENEYTLAPYDVLLEALGFGAEWNEKQRTVTATKDRLTIAFQLDSDKALVNGTARKLPAAVRMHGGKPFIPLRFTAETDGREVAWDGFNRTITIQESPAPVRFSATVRGDADPGYAALAKKLGETAGMDVRLNVIPPEHYNEKLMVLLAAGDISDVMMVADSAKFSTEILKSGFWDLTPYLADYPHLSKLVDEARARVVPQDKGVYGIPRLQSPYDGVFPVVRKDWLDVLGLGVPETTDELREALEQFTTHDPDGNGKNDTFGLAGAPDGLGLGSLAWIENVFNGSGGRLAVRDGHVIDTVTEPGTREALVWLNGVYAQGAVAKDFPAMSADQARQLALNGKAGVYAMTLAEARQTEAKLRESNPKAALVPLVSLRTPNGGAVVPMAAGSAGMLAVPRQVAKEKLPQVLAFLDHAVALADGSLPDGTDGLTQPERQLLAALTGTAGAAGTMTDEEREQADAVLHEREQIGFDGVVAQEMPRTSADLKKGVQLAQRIQQTKVKIILGELPIAAWDTFVADLKADADYQAWLKMWDGVQAP